MNRLVLSAQIAERGALRYTPAGLPALDLVLKHESEQSEAGQPRKVTLEMRAVAFGGLTQPLAALALGSKASFGGFLAAARNGRGMRLHITSVDAPSPPVQESNPGAHHAPTPR